MGMASHLGPWLLGTVKNTTGTTAGLVRNMGATTVGQTASINAATSLTGTVGYIPAGAIVTNVYLFTTTLFAGTPSVVVAIGGTTVTANPTFSTGIFNGAVSFAQTAAAGAVLNNVGTTDAAVTYTISGSGTTSGVGTILVEYMVRNSDGSAAPTSSQA